MSKSRGSSRWIPLRINRLTSYGRRRLSRYVSD